MYEAYFGLSERPFQLNPDPRFLFVSSGHRNAHAYLQTGVARGDGFVVVTGEVGAGKTILIRVLLDEIDPDKVVAVQLVSTQLDAGNLLRAVAIAFGVPTRYAGNDEIVARIEAYLVGLALRGKRALLVIDEAQNLASEAIDMLLRLSEFHSGHHPLLQCLLVGQPELRTLLRDPGMERLGQRIDATFHLGPMTQQETRAYIEHRLVQVGWKGDPVFDKMAFALLYRASQGIPRRINTLCNRLLLGAYLAQQHEITGIEVIEAAAELRVESVGSAAPPAPSPAAAAANAQPGPRKAVQSGPGPGMSGVPLAARLDRLEENVATMLKLAQALPARAAGASKPPAGSTQS